MTVQANKLFLIDRDGVLVVNRSDNIKTPAQLELIPGAAEAIARLNEAGWRVAMCTNQPEVWRGAMSAAELDEVHAALEARLGEVGARLDLILVCTTPVKCPARKPSAGMLREALRRFGAVAGETPFVGDQPDDMKAAFHAGCRRVFVHTGLGHKTEHKLPAWVRPVELHEDLAAAVDAELRRDAGRARSLAEAGKSAQE